MSEDYEDAEVEYEDDAPATRTTKPNHVFLARMLTGLHNTNQRVVDTTASKAARKAVGASGAASLRPVLARSAKQGPAAVRRAALTAAHQQKLTLCTSLLTEVALSFGFRLRVLGPDGGPISPMGGPQSPSQPISPKPPNQQQAGTAQQGREGEGEGEEEGAEEEEATEQPGAELTALAVPQPLPLEDLGVCLRLSANSGSGTGAMQLDGAGGGTAVRPGQVSRGSALLKAARPRIALNTLEGLGSALRRAAGTGPSPTALAGALRQQRQRVLQTKQAAAAAQADAGNELEGSKSAPASLGDEETLERAEGAGVETGQGGESCAGTGAGPGTAGKGSKARIVWQLGAGGGEGGPEPMVADMPAVAAAGNAPVGAGLGAGAAGGAMASGAVAAAAATTALRRALVVAGVGPAGAKTPGVARRSGSSTAGTGTGTGSGAGTGRGGSLDESVQGVGTPAPVAVTTTTAAGTGGGTGGAAAAGAGAGTDGRSTPQPGSGGKRPAAAGLNGLFSAALRDLKKVKQVAVDEGRHLLSKEHDVSGTKYYQLRYSACSKATGQEKFHPYPGPKVLQATRHATSSHAQVRAKENEAAV